MRGRIVIEKRYRAAVLIGEAHCGIKRYALSRGIVGNIAKCERCRHRMSPADHHHRGNRRSGDSIISDSIRSGGIATMRAINAYALKYRRARGNRGECWRRYR